MRKSVFVLAVAMFLSTLTINAQNYYFVGFNDKVGSDYTLDQPQQFLSERALARRARLGVAVDSLDLPVSSIYLDSIASLGVKVKHPLRWTNGCIAIMTQDVAREVDQLSFVRLVELTHLGTKLMYTPKSQAPSTVLPPEPFQNAMIGVDSMHKAGFFGQGVDIAVIDAGFNKVDRNPAFDTLRARNAILSEINLPHDESVYAREDHGACVLSTMGGWHNAFIGGSPHARYHLIVSECVDVEAPVECDFLCRAIEIADSAGVDIINVSLGYHEFDESSFDYTYSQMDGRTIRSSITTQLCAERGVICCVAIGNSGYSYTWPWLDTPGDAPDALTVGAVDALGQKAYFSSVGPSATGLIKPDLCTQGEESMFVNVDNYITHGNGTSFASPIMAGAVATLLSAVPRIEPALLIRLLKESGSNAASPNNQIGYGIPNVWNVYKRIVNEYPGLVDGIDDLSSRRNVLFAGDRLLFDGFDWGARYALYDLFGRRMASAEVGEMLSYDYLPAGVYLIRIADETFKVIKR